MKSNNGLHVQYGCGLSAPVEWINFDASPTLRIQKMPVLGFLLKRRLNINFPENVKYGDIVKGLPIAANSCDGIYCSHVLEHLSYNDFRKAVSNTYFHLKPGGIFRLIMPDLENLVNSYIGNKSAGNTEAGVKFMRDSGMAVEDKSKGFKLFLESTLGNARHLWLWDTSSTIAELEKAGFKNIRKCAFNDSTDSFFKLVEDEKRFRGAVCLEMTK